jgi:class 3 adenylate cyclase
VLVDRKTMAALEGAFEFDELGPFELKGFSKPVPAFSLKT